MSGRPLRAGIIGCGNVLDAYLPQCEKLRHRGWLELLAACGRESQAPRARAAGIKRFTTQARELIEDPDLELLLILTSMPTHAGLAEAALRAGKHVVLEKPLATTLPEAGKLVELARVSRGLLSCAPFVVLSPTFQTIARRIRAGDIGKACSARARYGWAGPWWSDWFYRPGGGCLFDLGVYCFTSLTGLLGPARRVSALAGIAIPEREIQGKKIRVEAEDNAQVSLDFGDACFGTVMTGFTLQQYRCPALEIYGTEGTIQMLGDDWDPDGYELWQNAAGSWQVFKETAPDWPWADGLRDTVECIHGGTRPLNTPEHALHVLEIMLKAQQSAREGRALALETTFVPPAFTEAKPGEAAHLQHDRSREHHDT
jgi:predicted dehydrogenase